MTTLDRLPVEDTVTMRTAIILLRLSDFRDEDDDGTFDRREEELRELAAGLGLMVPPWGVVIENEDDERADGRTKKSASAYKTPRKVRDDSGLITRRTSREKFTKVLLALQRGQAQVLIAGDESRLSRNRRDGDDLLDVCASSRASVVVPDEDGGAKWVLTDGGTAREREAFMDKVEDARKYSQSVSAKAKLGRRRWTGRSYAGGRRPFGYQVEKGTEEHRRNLVIDEREAAVLRHAADEILDHSGTLRALARELKTATGDAFVPTVSGAEWNGSILRDVLAKPATAGLAVKGRDENGKPKLIPAPWEPIIPRDRWERLVGLFESRKPGPGNEVKWLVSLIAECGICTDGTTMKVTGSADRRSYVCSAHGHLRRNAVKVDELVAARVIALLERDAPHLLTPPPRVTVDTGKLRDEAGKLRTRKTKLGAMYAAGHIDDDALASGTQVIRDRLDAIETELSASDVIDPLPEFRDPDADVLAVWDSLGLARQRAVVRLLYDIVIMPVEHPGGNKFDPDSVKMTRRT